MVNLKEVVDTSMNSILEEGKIGNNSKHGDIEEFYKAVVSNEKLCNGIANTMSEIAQKFAGCAMSGLEGDELKEMVCKISVAKPLLGMMYTAFRIGKEASGIEQMDKMFSLDSKESGMDGL